VDKISGKDFVHPDVSVVVPVHERLTGVDLAIESILAQTVPVREVIVVDDGSQKEIGEWIQQLIAEQPRWRGRVCYVRQKNRGQSAARNSGIVNDGAIRSADHEKARVLVENTRRSTGRSVSCPMTMVLM
jgi:glycosyltransferase involved in cell wall biosynthesis